MSQNMWSPFTSHQTTYSAPPPLCCSGLWSCSRQREGPITPWLKQPMDSNTWLHSPKWSDTAATTNNELNWKSTNGLSWPKLNKKTKHCQASNTTWKPMASMSNLLILKADSTSTASSQSATMPHTAQTCVTTAAVDQKVHPEGEVMLPPKQVAELLPWYMKWSCDLAAEMHYRHLVQNQACCTITPFLFL